MASEPQTIEVNVSTVPKNWRELVPDLTIIKLASEWNRRLREREVESNDGQS